MTTVRRLTARLVPPTGGDIGSHLQNLAERRTDIFGAGDEETIIGKKIGEEEKRGDDKVSQSPPHRCRWVASWDSLGLSLE